MRGYSLLGCAGGDLANKTVLLKGCGEEMSASAFFMWRVIPSTEMHDCQSNLTRPTPAPDPAKVDHVANLLRLHHDITHTQRRNFSTMVVLLKEQVLPD